jgi:hypothetical protein
MGIPVFQVPGKSKSLVSHVVFAEYVYNTSLL